MENIAIITQSLDSGGAERMAANLSVELAKFYNVYLFVFSTKNIQYKYGGTLICYNDNYKAKNLFSIIKRVIYTKKLKKKYNITCSISHQDRPNLVNVLSNTGDRKICCLHTSPTSVMKKTSMRAYLQKIACSLSDHYVGVSKVAVRDLIETFRYSKKKVLCIYNFCDNNAIREQMSMPVESTKIDAFLRNHKKIIVYSGRLIKSKGQDHLIRAFQIIRQNVDSCGMIFLGNGDKESEYKTLATKMKVENDILFAGNIKNPFNVMAKSTVFVMPSEYEGLPMVLIESMICGCPVISCDITSGPREILAPDTPISTQTEVVEHAKYGILVPTCKGNSIEDLKISKNEYVLANSVIEILTDDKMYEHYKSQTQVCVSLFDPSEVVKQWINIISK